MREQRDSDGSSVRSGLMRTLRSIGLSLSLASSGLALGCSTDTTDEPSLSGARIFASVSANSELLVLDDVTHAQIRSVPIGHGPAIVLKTPDDKQLFTANWADNTISAVDASSYAVTSIACAGRPYVIALSPDGKFLYAGLYTVNQIAVINTQTHLLERAFSMPSLPASIIVSPDGNTLYVAMLASGIGLGNGSLVAVSSSTGSITQQAIEVGGSPGWITINKDGSRVYTLNFTTDDVTVVNTSSWSVETTIKTGAGSQGIIGNVTPDGSRLYVTNHGTSELIAIDTTSNLIVQHIPLTGKPVGVAFNAAGTRVYTTDFGLDSVNESLIDSLTYLASGVYNGKGAGQVREFEIATGTPVGSTASTGPGPTSLVTIPAPPVVAAK